MKDIKKKFLDILFEPIEDEPEEVVVEEEVKKPIKEESSVKAKDILYKKSENSAFIDLNDLSKPIQVEEERKENDYEFASQISPIFGVLKESKRRTIKTEKETNDAIVNKPEDSHLETITSPIYGYGKQEDIDGNRNMTAGLLADESELHDLLDEEEIKENVVENHEDYLPLEDDYLEQESYQEEFDYPSDEYLQEEEEYDPYLEEEEDNSPEEDSIFTHQRYDIDEGEITLFDTIEDEE